MLLSFSKYGTDVEGAAAQDAVAYHAAESVPKQTVQGPVLVTRNPAPEILIGDPTLARAALRMAPGAVKYRSAVMSFAAGDVDAARFNAGDPLARGAVDLAIGLWSELAFAGIPPRCRPPIFVTTHTHLGRVEINLLVQRWITRSDGHLRSFNIDPPGPASRAGWDAFEDLLNGRFGWADPRDPARRRLVRAPDWHMKRQRTAVQIGRTGPRDLRTRLLEDLSGAVLANRLHDRAAVLDWVQAFCRDHGMIVHGRGADFITLGPPQAPPAARFRLRGELFSQDFAGAGPAPAAARAARSAELATAQARLDSAWQQRARFNGSRYGLGAWPDPTFSAQDWFARPLGARPEWIPATRLLPIAPEPRHADATADPDTDGTPPPLADPDPDRDGDGAAGPAGSQDRTAGPRPPHPRPGDPPLDRDARPLAGPAGPGLILAALTARLEAIGPHLAAQRQLQPPGGALPQPEHHLGEGLEEGEDLDPGHDPGPLPEALA